MKAECSYFGTCGGCAFQDLEYSTQLELKRRLVEEALSAFNSSHSFTISPTIPSPKPFHYRHMVAMTVKRRQDHLQFGFMSRDRRTFLSVESCPIADERINQFLPVALKKLEEMPPERKFHTSQVVLRIGDDREVVTSLRTDRGRKLECKIGGKIFSYSISSFFQNNFSILESFLKTVRSFLKPQGQGTLFDLYSGVGLFGILFADSYKQVMGIEEGYEAVQLALENTKRNGINNVSFLEGKVEALLPELISRAEKPLHVIVDPPRMGLKPEVIQRLSALPIDKLVYVSCELAALRRDLEALQEHFVISQVQPLDLFPQTKHVETILLLIPRS
ncbi:MAG: class I SAM-dependent RNA methyltransferase [Candidatus Omnitrophica bacterium]|nr:class I SAM-dependent RNA methyltransferase [Candidatus Omnitrophota bacterium]